MTMSSSIYDSPPKLLAIKQINSLNNNEFVARCMITKQTHLCICIISHSFKMNVKSITSKPNLKLKFKSLPRFTLDKLIS